MAHPSRTTLAVVLLALSATHPAAAQNRLSIADALKNEASGGVADSASFVVTLTRDPALDPGLTVSVPVRAVSGTARVVSTACANTPGADVSFSDQTLTFTGATLTKTVRVAICADDLDEEDSESFSLTLGTPLNASVARGTANGAVLDDDALPIAQMPGVSPIRVVEGAPGAGPLVRMPVRLNTPSGRSSSVTWRLNPFTGEKLSVGDCTQGKDFMLVGPTTLVFAAGEVEKSADVQVCGNYQYDDVRTERTMTVEFMSLTNIAFSTSGQSRRLTVVEDDTMPRVTLLALDGASASEGTGPNRQVRFAVRLDRIPVQNASVQLVVSGSAVRGTACTGSTDYVLDSPALLWTANTDVAHQVTVTLCADSRDDADAETISLSLSDAVQVRVGSAGQGFTIADDDPAPAISVDDIGVMEAASGTTTVRVTVRLSNASNLTIPFSYETADGLGIAAGGKNFAATGGAATCDPGVDYGRRSESAVTFAPGATTYVIAITICGDGVTEGMKVLNVSSGREEFLVRVSRPDTSPSTILKGVGTVVIRDP